MNFVKRLVILLVLVVVLATIGLAVSRLTNPHGRVELILQFPDTHGIAVTDNGQTLQISGLHAVYSLSVGSHRLTVTKPGYSRFSTSLSLGKGQLIVVNVAPQPLNAAPSASAATQQLTANIEPFLPSGFTVQRTTYFYNRTWVVAVVVADGGNTGIVVAQYDSSQAKWNIVLGPGTAFGPDSVANLPADVNNYMYQQTYVEQGLSNGQ